MVKSSVCKLALQFQVEVNSSVNRGANLNRKRTCSTFNTSHFVLIFFGPLPVQHEGTGILRWRSHRQQGSSSRT